MKIFTVLATATAVIFMGFFAVFAAIVTAADYAIHFVFSTKFLVFLGLVFCVWFAVSGKRCIPHIKKNSALSLIGFFVVSGILALIPVTTMIGKLLLLVGVPGSLFLMLCWYWTVTEEGPRPDPLPF